METPLKDLVTQYLSDLNPRSGETPSQIEVRSRRIKKNHDAILNQIVADFENVSEDGDSVDVRNEVPVGLINGVNKIFTTTYNFVPRSTIVTKTRLRFMLDEDYTETGDNEITFTTAPRINEYLLIDYKVGTTLV